MAKTKVDSAKIMVGNGGFARFCIPELVSGEINSLGDPYDCGMVESEDPEIAAVVPDLKFITKKLGTGKVLKLGSNESYYSPTAKEPVAEGDNADTITVVMLLDDVVYVALETQFLKEADDAVIAMKIGEARFADLGNLTASIDLLGRIIEFKRTGGDEFHTVQIKVKGGVAYTLSTGFLAADQGLVSYNSKMTTDDVDVDGLTAPETMPAFIAADITNWAKGKIVRKATS